MLNKYKITKPETKNKYAKLLIICGLLVNSSVNALDVNSGTFIQTIHTEALDESASLAVNDFFQGEESLNRFISDFENRDDTVFGPQPLSTNQFVYPVTSRSFIPPDHRNSIQTTNFSFDSGDVEETAKGVIGLDGVLRLDLADGRFFILGDWTVEYEKTRKDHGGSGWFLRNSYQIPGIGFDILNETVISNSDSFYLSGDLGWSPEFTEGFSSIIPKSELLRVVSSFTLCAQDDDAFSSNPAQQISCVFPDIKANGQTGMVSINSQENLDIKVDLGVASSNPSAAADYFVAFVHEETVYWLNQNFQWTTEPSAAYQGALIDLKSIAIPAPSVKFSSGSEVPVYFGVDTNQNGIFDEPYRFTLVSLKIK